MSIASKFSELKEIAMQSSAQAQNQINDEFEKLHELAQLFNDKPSYDNFRLLEIQINQSKEKLLKLAELKI